MSLKAIFFVLFFRMRDVGLEEGVEGVWKEWSDLWEKEEEKEKKKPERVANLG